MPEFSVIVPVYKVENYICRCIDSILAQTFTDFELILVDDGTPDKSGELCDQYAAQDKRIHVLHQENRGVSAARNVGLDMAKGKYVTFVDSDDEVEENYLSCMMKVNSEIDLVIGGIKHIDENGTLWNRTHYENKLLSDMTQENLLKILKNKAIDCVYAKRFNRSIIEGNHLRFDNSMNFGEDIYFMAEYLCVCKKVQYVDSDFYKYYKYTHNTGSSFSDDYVEKLEAVNEKVADVLSKCYPNITETLIWKLRKFSVYYYSIFYVLRNEKYGTIKKYRILKGMCRNKNFRKFAEKLDIYMSEDSRLLRRVIATKKPTVILLFWKILSIRDKDKIMGK